MDYPLDFSFTLFDNSIPDYQCAHQSISFISGVNTMLRKVAVVLGSLVLAAHASEVATEVDSEVSSDFPRYHGNL